MKLIISALVTRPSSLSLCYLKHASKSRSEKSPDSPISISYLFTNASVSYLANEGVLFENCLALEDLLDVSSRDFHRKMVARGQIVVNWSQVSFKSSARGAFMDWFWTDWCVTPLGLLPMNLGRWYKYFQFPRGLCSRVYRPAKT